MSSSVDGAALGKGTGDTTGNRVGNSMLLRDVIMLRRSDVRIGALVLGVVAVFFSTYLVLGASDLTVTVAALISLAAALLVAVQIRGKLSRVGKAMDDLTAGKLDYRLEVKGADSISSLDRSFNAMASSLEQGMARLRQERNLIRSIHQGITDGIIVFDRLGRIMSANPAAEAAIGRLERDIIGSWDIGVPGIEKLATAAELVPVVDQVRCREAKNCTHPECPSYDSEDLRCWLQCGTCCHNEIQGTFREKRDACERCDVYLHNGLAHANVEMEGTSYAVTVSPILNQDGSEEGRIAVLHDITEISRARLKLLKQNEELALMNTVVTSLSGSLGDMDGVLEQTMDMVVDSVDTAAAAIIQIDCDCGVVKRVWSQRLPAQVGVLLQMIEVDIEAARLHDGFVPPEKVLRRSRGLMGALGNAGLTPAVAVPLHHRGSVYGIMLLAGGNCAELSRSETNLINAITANMGVAIQNQELFDSITKAKQAWEATFDSMGDAVSLHDADFNIMRVNAAMARITEMRPEELVGRKCYEVIHGTCEPIADCPVREVMRTGRSYSSEITEEYLGRTFRVTINPVRDSGGEAVGIVHVMKDITERKLLREQLLQSEKMAAVGQLVSGVAHELNNPLTGVLGFSQLLMRKCDDSIKQVIGPEVEAIAGEAQRASRIVQNLLSFARKHKAQKTMVDISEAIRTVMDLRAYELNVRNISLEADLDVDLPLIMADMHQIEQVFLNIINNAEQAISESGGPGAIRLATRSDGSRIEVVISDTGTGMTSEVMHRIFEPFFTTKEVGQGTGLGLSICYGIIEEHGGEIRAESQPGAGTTLTVVLPVTGTDIAAPGGLEGVITGDRRRRVLVVDDEPAIVDLLKDILTMEGHGVDIAQNGKLALEKMGSVHYDNVITDIKMPEMDGKELHRRISEIDPQLAANVIFITGDAIGRDTREFLRSTGNIYLAKPFNIHELRERLHKVMNGYE